jgi:D-alanyl-lipoteichoic acid acyltransferase DltB (MBOAT superfamily)
MLSTFTFVTIAWVFFRAETLGDAVEYIGKAIYDIFLNPRQLIHKPIIQSSSDFQAILILIMVIVILGLDWTNRLNERQIFNNSNKLNRFILYLMTVVLLICFSESESFIYFNF